MNLLNDILVWTQTLLNWQRDAVRRLLQREDGLSEEDYAELYGLLKAEHKLGNPDQLTPEPLGEGKSSGLPFSSKLWKSYHAQDMGLLAVSKGNTNPLAYGSLWARHSKANS